MQNSRRGVGDLYACALYIKDLYTSHMCAADLNAVVGVPCLIGRQAYGNLFSQGHHLMDWSREMVRVAPPHNMFIHMFNLYARAMSAMDMYIGDLYAKDLCVTRGYQSGAASMTSFDGVASSPSEAWCMMKNLNLTYPRRRQESKQGSDPLIHPNGRTRRRSNPERPAGR